MPLSSEINVFAESLDFFVLLRDLSPLDPGAHWPEPHVLRSSSSWLSQICLEASGVSSEGVWGWSWIARDTFFWKKVSKPTDTLYADVCVKREA